MLTDSLSTGPRGGDYSEPETKDDTEGGIEGAPYDPNASESGGTLWAAGMEQANITRLQRRYNLGYLSLHSQKQRNTALTLSPAPNIYICVCRCVYTNCKRFVRHAVGRRYGSSQHDTATAQVQLDTYHSIHTNCIYMYIYMCVCIYIPIASAS